MLFTGWKSGCCSEYSYHLPTPCVAEDIQIDIRIYTLYVFLGKDTAKYDRNNEPSQLKSNHNIITQCCACACTQVPLVVQISL